MTTIAALLALSTAADPTHEPAPRAPLPAAVADDLPDFSYTFVEANYLWQDVDGPDDELDGFEGKVSIGLPLTLFLQGSYARLTGDTDVDFYRLGLGAHLPILNRLDAYGIVSWAFQDAEGSGIDTSDDGPSAELGLRLFLSDWLELNGKAEWVRLDEDDQANYGGGARFYVMDALSLGGEVESIDGDLAASAGVRFQL